MNTPPSSRSAPLAADHCLIDRVFLAELFVGAIGDDAAVFEDQDAVGDGDGAEAVGDDEGGAAFHQFGERVLDHGLAFAESSALVASSRMRIGASRRKARAMAMRWRWPPESWSPRSPTSV
jgi:hypothetical protein